MSKNTNTKLLLSMKIIMGVLCTIVIFILIPLVTVQITTGIAKKNLTLPKMPFTDFYYCPISDSVDKFAYESGTLLLIKSQNNYNIDDQVFVKNEYYDANSLNLQKAVMIGKVSVIDAEKYIVTIASDDEIPVTVTVTNEQIIGLSTYKLKNCGKIYDELDGIRGILLYGAIPILFLFLIYFILKMISTILFNREIIKEQHYEAMLESEEKEKSKDSKNSLINNGDSIFVLKPNPNPDSPQQPEFDEFDQPQPDQSQPHQPQPDHTKAKPQTKMSKAYQELLSVENVPLIKEPIDSKNQANQVSGTEQVSGTNKVSGANQVNAKTNEKPTQIPTEPIIVKVGGIPPIVSPIASNDVSSPTMQEKTKIYPISQKPIPTITISEVEEVDQPKVDVEKIEVEKPQTEQPKVEQAQLEVEKIEIEKPQVDVEKPKLDVEKVEVEKPKVEQPKLDVEKIEVEQARLDVEKIEVEKPQVDVEQPKLEVEQPKVDVEKVEIDENNSGWRTAETILPISQKPIPTITISEVEVEVEQPKLEQAQLEVEQPKVDVEKIEVDKVEQPKLEVEKIEVEQARLDVEKIEVEQPKVDVEKIEVAENNSGWRTAETILPISQKPIPTITISELEVEQSQTEQPQLEVEKIEVEKPQVDVEQPKVDVEKIEVEENNSGWRTAETILPISQKPIPTITISEVEVEQSQTEQPNLEQAQLEVEKIEVEKPQVDVEKPKVDVEKIEVEENNSGWRTAETILPISQKPIQTITISELEIEQPKVDLEKIDVEKIDVEQSKLEQPKVEQAQLEVEKVEVEKPQVDVEQPKLEVEKPKLDENDIKIATIYQDSEITTKQLREKNGLTKKSKIDSKDDNENMAQLDDDAFELLSADEIIKLYRETGSTTIRLELSRKKEKKLDDLAQLYYDNDLENYENYDEYAKNKEEEKSETKLEK